MKTFGGYILIFAFVQMSKFSISIVLGLLEIAFKDR